MTTLFAEDEEDELLLVPIVETDEDIISDDDESPEADDDGELTLDRAEELEEEENIGHKVQTYDPADDGTDNYFDERYFDE